MEIWGKIRRTSNTELFPFPTENSVVLETPPCFSWLLQGKDIVYTVVLLKKGKEIWRTETKNNFAYPDFPLAAGEYTWDVLGAGGHRGEQTFTVSEDAVPFIRPDADEIFRSIPKGHPRHLFCSEDILVFLKEKQTELGTLDRNVSLALKRDIPARPMFHKDPNALPYREYFGMFRDYFDRDLVALSLGYALQNNLEAGKHAKELLLTFCDWNPAGPCSLDGKYGDEVGLSFARCLPSVYDLLYSLLTDGERDLVADTVAEYAYQCERRLLKLNFTENPGNSHAGRLPAYLGEAALVLSDSGAVSAETCRRWLGYAVDVYGGIFPHYGGTDGGWAEGPFYATSYVRWFVPFFSAVERYTGKSFLNRPYYRNLTSFLLCFADPAYENHPFGDGYWSAGESDTEWPGFFAQNPFRYYATRFGPPLAMEKGNEYENRSYYKLHLLDLFLPSPKTGEKSLKKENPPRLSVFPDTGFVAMRTNPEDFNKNLVCLVRASRYGSDSHRYPDQGGFSLLYRGVSLISPSGYFGRRYGSLHHRKWTNTSKAHNVPLIGGVGQYENDYRAIGTILSWNDDGKTERASVDCGKAYPVQVAWKRDFALTENELKLSDDFRLETVADITICFHTLSRPVVDGNGFAIERNGVKMVCRPIGFASVFPEISDSFDIPLNEGEPAEYAVTMPQQYHIYYTFPACTDLKTEFVFSISE